MNPSEGDCTTCYGTGEVVTEHGPVTCTDCFGDGKQLGRSAKVEWRLREIERLHRGSGHDSEPDILWLVRELRRCREALTAIFTRCQDAEEGDALAADVKFRANEALELYAARSPGGVSDDDAAEDREDQERF
jgi:hypothetical protein